MSRSQLGRGQGRPPVPSTDATPTIDPRFGQRLKAARLDAGVAQRDLAGLVGIHHTYLSKIETGKMPPPSRQTITLLAEALEIDLDELITEGGKLPRDVVEILTEQPELIELVRAASAFKPSSVEKMTQQLRDLMKKGEA